MDRKYICKDMALKVGSVDEANRTVTMMIMQANEPDLQLDRISPAEIGKALDYYMANSQVIGRMHTEETNNYPVRVWQDVTGSGWLTIKVVDDGDWNDIMAGRLRGTSWGGYAEVGKGEPDGSVWLENIAMLEDSLVDWPAVQTARFKSDEAPPEEWVSLAERIRAGEVKRRVIEPVAKRAIAELTERLERLDERINKYATPANGGEENTGGSLMNPDEIKAAIAEAVKPLVDDVAALAAKVEGMETKAEAEPEPEKDTEQAEALAAAEAKVAELEASNAELQAKLDAVPASGKQDHDGNEEVATFKPARCERL